MPEKSLSLPLSGLEIRTALLERIGESLQKDCFLSPNLAYDYFSAKVHIEILAHDLGRDAEVKQDVQYTVGDEPEGGAGGVEGEFTVEPVPPNEVRVQSGQAVPTLASVDGKTTVKGVKYARKAAKRNA